MAVDKPAGILVIPGRGVDEPPSLRERLEAQLNRRTFVVHRLDRFTSGAVLFALDASTHRALSMAFEAGRVRKVYLALVRGTLDRPCEFTDPLDSARRGRMKVTCPGQGKPAHTLVRPIETFGNVTLLEAEPLTGRTHQIRVHLSHAGYPLLMDTQYGMHAPVTALQLGGRSDEIVLQRTPLHAASLELPSGLAIGFHRVTSPLPPDMARALEILRTRGSAQK